MSVRYISHELRIILLSESLPCLIGPTQVPYTTGDEENKYSGTRDPELAKETNTMDDGGKLNPVSLETQERLCMILEAAKVGQFDAETVDKTIGKELWEVQWERDGLLT